MNILESISLINLKRCPSCNQNDLTVINLFSVKAFEEQGYIDLFCPHCMYSIEKDRYGRTIRLTSFSNEKKRYFKPHFSLTAKTKIFLPSPKAQRVNAFLIKRSDLNE